MKLIMVGCGETGKKLLSNWEDRRYKILAIDQNAVALDKVSAIRPLEIQQGDVSDLRTLIRAGVDHCNVFLALTGDDQINLFSSFLAREIFKVDKIVCRLQHGSYAEIFTGQHFFYINTGDAIVQKIKAIL